MSGIDQYGVLNPWAESDPVPLKGISSRLENLDGKKIGIFRNFKQGADQIGITIGEKLKERYPGVETILFDSTDQNVNVIETDKKDEFVKWAEGIDAAVLVLGN